jgi:hypothetical protein
MRSYFSGEPRCERSSALPAQKPHAIGDSVQFHPLARDFDRTRRQVHRSHLRPGARKARRVRADAAPNLEHALAAPALEVGKARNVRLNQIAPRVHFVEIFARSHRRGECRMLQGRRFQNSSTCSIGTCSKEVSIHANRSPGKSAPPAASHPCSFYRAAGLRPAALLGRFPRCAPSRSAAGKQNPAARSRKTPEQQPLDCRPSFSRKSVRAQEPGAYPTETRTPDSTR